MDATCKHADRRCINTHRLSADIIYLMINLKLKGLLPNDGESSVEFIQSLVISLQISRLHCREVDQGS